MAELILNGTQGKSVRIVGGNIVNKADPVLSGAAASHDKPGTWRNGLESADREDQAHP